MAKRKTVPRPRNGGKWTEAEFWSRIRSALRQASRYWLPAQKAVQRHSRPYTGHLKRRRTEVQCQMCHEWVPPSRIDKDHVVPVGSLRCAEDLPGFVERLFAEDAGAYRPLCKDCHKKLNKEQRSKK